MVCFLFAMKYDWLIFDFFFHLILKKEGAGRKRGESKLITFGFG